MRRIGSFIFLISCFVLDCSYSCVLEHKIVDCTYKNKIELIKSEIAYIKFLCFNTKIGYLQPEESLPWIIEICDFIEMQLEEMDNFSVKDQ